MIFLRYYLWVMPHILCLATLIVAWKRKLYTTVPYFLIYLGFTVFTFALMFTVASLHLRTLYYWVLLVETVAEFILELSVFYEILNRLVFSHSSLARVFRPLPQWTLATLILLAVGLSAMLPETLRDHLIRLFSTLDFSAYLIAIGLLFGLLLFTRILGISWHSVPAGIVLGFGVSAIAEISGSMLLAKAGTSGNITSDLIRMGGFHVCAIIWLVYVLLPEKPKRLAGSGVQLAEIELRVQELRRIVRK